MRSHPKGFTIIELLLYLAISAIILLATSLFLSTLLQSRIKNQTVAEVEGQGLQVMQLITQTVRNVDTIISPTIGTTGASLSVNTSVSGNNPTIFDLNSGVVQIKEGAAVAVPLTNARVVVSDLAFFNLSRASTPGAVKVQFTITAVNNSGRNEYSYTKTFVGSAALRQP